MLLTDASITRPSCPRGSVRWALTRKRDVEINVWPLVMERRFPERNRDNRRLPKHVVDKVGHAVAFANISFSSVQTPPPDAFYSSALSVSSALDESEEASINPPDYGNVIFHVGLSTVTP